MVIGTFLPPHGERLSWWFWYKLWGIEYSPALPVGRVPPNEWKQLLLETTPLWLLTLPSPERSNKHPIPKQPKGQYHLAQPAYSPTLRAYLGFNKLLCTCYFPSGSLYRSMDPHVNLFTGNARTLTSIHTPDFPTGNIFNCLIKVWLSSDPLKEAKSILAVLTSYLNLHGPLFSYHWPALPSIFKEVTL